MVFASSKLVNLGRYGEIYIGSIPLILYCCLVTRIFDCLLACFLSLSH